jgi:hypothetical protein
MKTMMCLGSDDWILKVGARVAEGRGVGSVDGFKEGRSVGFGEGALSFGALVGKVPRLTGDLVAWMGVGAAEGFFCVFLKYIEGFDVEAVLGLGEIPIGSEVGALVGESSSGLLLLRTIIISVSKPTFVLSAQKTNGAKKRRNKMKNKS